MSPLEGPVLYEGPSATEQHPMESPAGSEKASRLLVIRTTLEMGSTRILFVMKIVLKSFLFKWRIILTQYKNV